MADQDLLISFTFDRLDTVHHSNIFAHLESNFCHLKFNKFQSLLTDSFIKLVAKFLR